MLIFSLPISSGVALGRELIDCVLSINDLWGMEGKNLALRVVESTSMLERLQLIQVFLRKRLRTEPADGLVECAVSSLYRESSSISIEQLAMRMKIGQRQMERRFLQLTGQSPAGACQKFCV